MILRTVYCTVTVSPQVPASACDIKATAVIPLVNKYMELFFRDKQVNNHALDCNIYPTMFNVASAAKYKMNKVLDFLLQVHIPQQI